MATCRECFKDFHACFSCGLYGYEWHFCNEVCWDTFVKEIIDEFRDHYPDSRNVEDHQIRFIVEKSL